jgi:hypothetical protein
MEDIIQLPQAIDILPVAIDILPVAIDILPNINKNLCSSTLFIFPAVYAYLILPRYSLVMFGSIVCLITSITNHYYKNQNNLFRTIDIFTVVAIAAYFTIHCLFNIGFKFYSNIVYILVIMSLCTYYYVNYYNPCDYHYLVHIFAITGIMLYIKSIKTYLSKEEIIPQEDEKIGVCPMGF